MSAAERNVVISTDSSGALGTPRVWKDVWGFMSEYSGFKGYEMIGWGGGVFRFWTDYLLAQAKKNGCNVVGIHGRTGPLYGNTNLVQGLLVRSLSAFMIPTHELLEQYRQDIEYVLVHSGELASPARRDRLFKPEGNHFNGLFIENDTVVGGVCYATTLAKQIYRSYEIKAGVMFDLWHYIASLGKENKFTDNWERTMNRLEWLFEQVYCDGTPVLVGIHLPIGTLAWDSLPIRIMTKDMWKRLAVVLDKRPGTLVVIENQQSSPVSWILPTKKERVAQRARNQRIIDDLSKEDVI